MVAMKTKGEAGETFNVGTRKATAVNRLAGMIFEVNDKTHLKTMHSKPIKGDKKHSCADISKAKNEAPLIPKGLVERGVEGSYKRF